MRSPLEQIWFDIFTAENIKFSEQVSVGPYLADFIIGNFDVEIDGLQHRVTKRNIQRDKKRDLYFENLGFTVIRVPMNYHSFNKKKHQLRFKQQVEQVLELVK